MTITRAAGAMRHPDRFASLSSVLILFLLLVNAAFSSFPMVYGPGEVHVEDPDAAPRPAFASENRQIIVADTYLVIDSPSRAYHGDPYYVYGTLYEKGANLDIGAPNCPVHIYWSDGPYGEEFLTHTSDDDGFKGYWRMPITVNHTEGVYPLFIEFRGQVFINGSMQEYDANDPHHHKDDGSPRNMTRFPSNVTLDRVNVFYHSFVDAEISTTNLEVGESFWLNGSVKVNETGEPIGRAILNITLDGTTIDTVKTLANGSFGKLLRLSNSNPPGGHSIRVEYWQFAYDENGDYGSSYSYFGIMFLQKPVIGIGSTLIFAGESATVNGTVLDLRGEPLFDPLHPARSFHVCGELRNETVQQSYDLGEATVLNGTHFIFTFTVPRDFPSSLADIIVSFPEDSLYMPAEKSLGVSVVTQPSLTVDDLNFDEPSENITGRVVDGGRRGLSADISIIIDGEEVARGRSDGDGYFRIVVYLPDGTGISELVVTVMVPDTSFSLGTNVDIEASVLASAVLLPDLFIDPGSLEIEYRLPGDGSGELNVSFLVGNRGNVPSMPTSIRLESLPGLDENIYLEEIPPGAVIDKHFRWKVKANTTLSITVDPYETLLEIHKDDNLLIYTLGRKLYDMDRDGINNFEDNDTDGDSHTDEEELLAGSNPYDSRSRPEPDPNGQEDDTDENEVEENDVGFIWPLVMITVVVVTIVAVIAAIKFRKGSGG